MLKQPTTPRNLRVDVWHQCRLVDLNMPMMDPWNDYIFAYMNGIKCMVNDQYGWVFHGDFSWVTFDGYLHGSYGWFMVGSM